MANSLDRNIEEGEVVIISKEYMKPEYHGIEHRLFIASGGFGMSGFTTGSAIYGKTPGNDESFRIEGYMIDKQETEKYQAENGKFQKPN